MARKPPRICPVCNQAVTRGHTHRATVTYAETQRRRATVEAWRDKYGNWCPGYNRDGHVSRDLTADHVIPRAHGGETGPLRVLCRQCNSARKAGPR